MNRVALTRTLFGIGLQFGPMWNLQKEPHAFSRLYSKPGMDVYLAFRSVEWSNNPH
jgi:hypothetical protein